MPRRILPFNWLRRGRIRGIKEARSGRAAVVVLVLCVFLAGCEEEEYTSVIISSGPEGSGIQLQEFEGSDVMLVLLKEVPGFSESGLLNRFLVLPYSLTKIKDGVINARMSKGFNYWIGSGYFFILFMLPNPENSSVSDGYISINQEDISKDVNNFSTEQFKAPEIILVNIFGAL